MTPKKNLKASKFVYWTPRILSIILIIFMALMSLDVISPEVSLAEIIVGLLMHNIPVFILAIILLISWRHEIVGGIAFFLAGAIYIVALLVSGIPWHLAISWSMIIAGPAFIIGYLFLVNWKLKKGYKQ